MISPADVMLLWLMVIAVVWLLGEIWGKWVDPRGRD